MAQEVVLWLNGTRVSVSGAWAAASLACWLRDDRRLTGTKVACGTGDCGSCTVLVAPPHVSPPRWHAVNACLQFVHQLHGCEVRTVEGLGHEHALSPVQQALVDGHGTQCGMCTPGFVVQMTDALQTPPRGAANGAGWWAQALRGNVCRCTGYTAIFDAGIAAANGEGGPMASCVPSFTAPWLSERRALAATALDLTHGSATERHRRRTRTRTLRPATLTQALAAAAAVPECIIAAGTTDLAVDGPAAHDADAVWLDISGLHELTSVTVERTSGAPVLSIGALATWRQLQPIADTYCAPLATLLPRMGGPQIHAAATVGGNVMTASPIGDLLPLFLVMNATLEFSHRDGVRRVPVSEAITGYRQVDRRAGELLTRIDVPLPAAHEQLVLEKVSRRRDMDIATVSLAARWHRDADGALSGVALAAGGVGPRVLRLATAESVLSGSQGTAADWEHAALAAADSVAPRDDVRGSAGYRRRVLTRLITSLSARAPIGATHA